MSIIDRYSADTDRPAFLFLQELPHNDDFCIDLEAATPDDRQAWQWAGYTQLNNAIRGLRNSVLLEGVDYLTLNCDQQIPGKAGSVRNVQKTRYLFTFDGFKQFLMLAGTIEGRNTRLYFIRAEKELKRVLLNQAEHPRGRRESDRGMVARTAKAPTPRQICSALEMVFGQVLSTQVLANLKFDGVVYVHPSLEGALRPGLAALPPVAVEEKLYTVGEIAAMLAERMGSDKPLSAMRLNKLMEQWGMQKRDAAGDWKPVDGPAKEFCDYHMPTVNGIKSNCIRKLVYQLKWKAAVVDFILPLAQEALA